MLVSGAIVYGTFWFLEGRAVSIDDAARRYPLAAGQPQESAGAPAADPAVQGRLHAQERAARRAQQLRLGGQGQRRRPHPDRAGDAAHAGARAAGPPGQRCRHRRRWWCRTPRPAGRRRRDRPVSEHHATPQLHRAPRRPGPDRARCRRRHSRARRACVRRRRRRPARRRTALQQVRFDQKLDARLPLDATLPRRVRPRGAPRRVLRQQAGGAGLRLLRVPDALHPDPQRAGERAGRARSDGRAGVRRRRDQLRRARDPGDGGGQEGGLPRHLQAAGRRAGLALPHRRRRQHPPRDRRRRLPVRLGRGDAAVRARQRRDRRPRPTAGCRATSSASSTRRGT